jgi:RNA polymerase sigma-70 factor (ECF subfamily)
MGLPKNEMMKFITDCSKSTRSGDEVETMAAIYDDLRAIAANYLRRERDGHTLQPTALVHEAFLRLAQSAKTTWQDGAHFSAVAAHVMRQVLIDHARRSRAQKRGGTAARIPLDIAIAIETSNPDLDLVELGDLLDRLEKLNERHARVVELRFFANLSIKETAEVLEVSETTVKDDWQMARAWLQAQLKQR